MRIEDANHSGHHKKNVPGFVDNFSEDFEAPFPDEFNLSEFYQSKGHTVYNMIPYIYIDVWFNPCEKMPFNRFMNQYYRWSTAIYRYFSNVKDMDVSMYFSFYNNEVPKYSISTFEMHDGQVKGLTKPLKRIYHSLYGEDANVDDNNDVLARRVMMRTTERMDVYIQKMIAYGRLKHHINVMFVDRFEQQISDYETLKRWGYNAGQPESSKILAFRVEAIDEKEVKMSAVEDTVIGGFFCQLPTNAVKMFQFMFIMQIMQKFVDDAEQERQKKLEDKNITWTERNELKRGRNYYGTGLGSAYTEAAEAYNDENSKRKQYWRIRQGRINSSGKEFAILCVDKNGKICRADNTSLGIFGDLRNLWNKACAMIEDMKE